MYLNKADMTASAWVDSSRRTRDVLRVALQNPPRATLGQVSKDNSGLERWGSRRTLGSPHHLMDKNREHSHQYT